MEIRKADEADISRIMEIYALAREYMKQCGNPEQWGDGYPGECSVRKDFDEKCLYVIENEKQVIAVFSFFTRTEPTYRELEGGEWHGHGSYGTIHRLASDGSQRNIAAKCFEFCSKQSCYLRIDTHRKNRTMRMCLTNYGFRECGIIHIEDGTERIAYDYSLTTE